MLGCELLLPPTEMLRCDSWARRFLLFGPQRASALLVQTLIGGIMGALTNERQMAMES